MIELGVYLVVTAVLFVVAIRIGMILAVRIDRRLTTPDAAPSAPPEAPHEEEP